MTDRIMIAMSGGVDSSVAASLTMEKFEECAGATMKLLPEYDTTDARKVTEILGIPFYEFEFQEQFEECIINTFIDTYKRGKTPNPCVICNKEMKFGLFRQKALELGYNKIATGHYARILFDPDLNRYILKKAVDQRKDQSYFLYSLSRQQLENTLFPLGELTKKEVREIAQHNSFENADKQESQDICFIPDDDYGDYIEKYTDEESSKGEFVDMEGNHLGIHKGIIRYTIGQRKGLGLALPEPMYVYEKDIVNNRIILSKNDQLFSDTVTADNINLISVDNIENPIKIKAKIRYNQTEKSATAVQTDNDELKVVFDEPQRAIAGGQSVVIYDGDTVVGGGVITN